MGIPSDYLGDILRDFYGTFGRPGEGPPKQFNVGKHLKDMPVDKAELDLLVTALDDRRLRSEFANCSLILEDLFARLTSEEVLREFSGIAISHRDFQQLLGGVLWFNLAKGIDRRDASGMPTTPFEDALEMPNSVKFTMIVEGSLVLRLYVALVFMREGILNELIKQGIDSGSHCCGQIRALLNSDYVRHIRNALSHGTFSAGIAGLVFIDKKYMVVATPGFLEYLGDCLMMIQLHALTACAMNYAKE
ncbi:MAG: hypothetical protein AB1384_12360 [Actinomycetota bacterium]